MKPFARPLRTSRKNVARTFGFTFLASLITCPLFGAGITVRFTGDCGGKAGRYSRALAEQWARKTGNKVEYIGRPSDASAALQQYQE
jgi:hypothetical protein